MTTTRQNVQRILLATLCAFPVLVFAQPSTEEPQLLTLWLESPSIVFDAEKKTETRKSPDPLNSYEQETVRLKPSLDFTLRGSVYHPNFLEFYFHGMEGLDSEETKTTLADEYNTSSQSWFHNYNANALLFREKPVTFQVFAEKNTSRREYDFFSTVEVDSQRYGMSSGINNTRLPTSVSVSHLDETVDDQSRPSTLTEDVAGVTLRSQRGNDNSTDFNYQYRNYERTENDEFTQSGIENSVQVGDVERFGQRDQFRLDSNLSAFDLESDDGSYNSLSLRESLVNRHRPNLESIYRYNFSQNARDTSRNHTHEASAGLRHRLYQSLVSSGELHGERSVVDSADDRLEKDLYGINLGEDYTKRLGIWGRLSAGYHVRVDQEQWNATGTGGFPVIGELHTLADGIVTLLNYPVANIQGIRIMDLTATRLYLPGVDYTVIPHGNRVEIRRGVTGVIPNGGSVLVDYDATKANSSNFRSFGDMASLRLDLFGDLIGLYARYGRQRYSGDGAPLYQEYDSALLGMDIHWEFFRGGAEHEIYDSEQSPYTATRLFETFTFTPNTYSMLMFDFRQSKLQFPDQAEDQDIYQFIGQYQVRVTSTLSLSAEGGQQFDRGFGGDRDITTWRAGADYAIGRLTFSARYDVQDETYRDEERNRRIIHFTAKRIF
jgi:hypothetical protein